VLLNNIEQIAPKTVQRKELTSRASTPKKDLSTFSGVGGSIRHVDALWVRSSARARQQNFVTTEQL
jgi:hypothetical protein